METRLCTRPPAGQGRRALGQPPAAAKAAATGRQLRRRWSTAVLGLAVALGAALAAAEPGAGDTPGAASPGLPVITNHLGMNFVRLPAGSFAMGSHRGPAEERPVHQVTIRRAFYLQTTEVTQGQWKALLGHNPSDFRNCGDDCPVEQVSWLEAQEFIRRLNLAEGTDKYRLPTEAEWEYAARAGSPGDYCFGDAVARLGDYAWYQANSQGRTQRVASKKPNAWGLYDLHGNVGEWVADWAGAYPAGPVSDPQGPGRGSDRVLRGGAWNDDVASQRAADRLWLPPTLHYYSVGFRLVREE
ncbi:MAG: formylglycine-generating enzyme family protein [Deltaproteobacteria bacterium]|nr:formylglycine-generating enzyme family protein [Deltaproteobacteria bacterium]